MPYHYHVIPCPVLAYCIITGRYPPSHVVLDHHHGPALAYRVAAISLRAYFAKSGTDTPYGAAEDFVGHVDSQVETAPCFSNHAVPFRRMPQNL
eukprot:3107163-Rhodomonas_salina.1